MHALYCFLLPPFVVDAYLPSLPHILVLLLILLCLSVFLPIYSSFFHTFLPLFHLSALPTHTYSPPPPRVSDSRRSEDDGLFQHIHIAILHPWVSDSRRSEDDGLQCCRTQIESLIGYLLRHHTITSTGIRKKNYCISHSTPSYLRFLLCSQLC